MKILRDFGALLSCGMGSGRKKMKKTLFDWRLTTTMRDFSIRNTLRIVLFIFSLSLFAVVHSLWIQIRRNIKEEEEVVWRRRQDINWMTMIWNEFRVDVVSGNLMRSKEIFKLKLFVEIFYIKKFAAGIDWPGKFFKYLWCNFYSLFTLQKMLI